MMMMPALQAHVLDVLEDSGARYVRFAWLDLGSCLRYKIFSVKHFKKILASARGGYAMTEAGLQAVFLSFAPGSSMIDEFVHRPDLSTLRLLPHADGDAIVLGDWLKQVDNGSGEIELQDAELCPRSHLRRVVESAKKAAGVDFLIGVETEFFLLKSTSPVEAANTHSYCCASATASGTIVARALREITNAMSDAGIEVEMLHSEGAPGQYEISTAPLPPMEAADALVYTREIIQDVASKHGLKATFAPRVFDDSLASGSHTHVSLKSDQPTPTASVEGAPGMTELEASWLQSLLTHLPAIIPFTMPTPASFDRMVDNLATGGTYAAWGKNNRMCPVRLCGTARDWNFEVKSVDGLSNPHLAFAAIIAAGMIGVKEGAKLEMKNCRDSPAELTEEQRVALGITTRLPLTLEESWERLKADKALVNELGEYFVERYLAVNKMWASLMTAPTPEETRRLYIENY